MGESLSGPTATGSWAQAVPMALKGLSSVVGMFGQSRSNDAERSAIDAIERQGQSVKALKEWEARQLEAEGLSRFAGEQRKGLAEKRKGKLIASALTARAAAQGGGGDPTVMKLAGGIDAEAAYRMAMALAAGQEARKGYQTAAAGKRFEGDQAVMGANARASGMRKGMQTKSYGRAASALGDVAKSDLWSKFGEWFEDEAPPVWGPGGK